MIHDPIPLVLGIVILVNIILLLVVGAWWLANARNRAFPHRTFFKWYALLLASVASYLPSDDHYAAVAVLLFGPGPNSVNLQMESAARPTLLLEALFLRGARFDKKILCLRGYASDNPSVVTRLIERGVPINEQCLPERRTALHNAVQEKKYRSAEALMRAGARTDIPDVNGRTPLDLAIRLGDERMISIVKDDHRP